MRYLGPFQLYLIAAALFFFANSLSPFMSVERETMSVRGGLGIMAVGNAMTNEERDRRVASGITPEHFESELRSTANNQLPAFLVVVIVAFALLLLVLVHPRRERNVLKHLVFALHWMSFYLLLMITERITGRQDEPGFVGLTLALVGLLWLMLALRRVYGQSWWLVVPKAVVLYLAFNVLLGGWVAAILAWAMYTM
jgi:hypothetical protein